MSGINNAFTLNINTFQNNSKILCTESGNSKNKETRMNTVTLHTQLCPLILRTTVQRPGP